MNPKEVILSWEDYEELRAKENELRKVKEELELLRLGIIQDAEIVVCEIDKPNNKIVSFYIITENQWNKVQDKTKFLQVNG